MRKGGGDNGSRGPGLMRRRVILIVLLAVVSLGVSLATVALVINMTDNETGAEAGISGSYRPFVPKPKMGSEAPYKPLEPWGYNMDRNKVRWKGIHASMAQDVASGMFSSGSESDARKDYFSLVDYGSDQGYFSISVANAFPQARIMSVEIGGVGGEIWKEAGQMDVLEVQEKMIEKHVIAVDQAANGGESLSRVIICQTHVEPEQFAQLNRPATIGSDSPAMGLIRTDYQFVLSVFHWFKLNSVAEFQEVIVNLFLNANVATFIELPIAKSDPNAPPDVRARQQAKEHLIQKQVGYKLFSTWYGGEHNLASVIERAGTAHNVELRVTAVAETAWIEWTRITYRVEVVRGSGKTPREKLLSRRRGTSFNCGEHQRILGCAPRTQYTTCLDKW